MKIAILDSGYAHTHAHHQAANLGVARSALTRGDEVVIIASYDLNQEARRACAVEGVEVSAYFRTPGYPRDADHLPPAEHERLVEQYAHEIAALFESGYLDNGTHLLTHTGYSFHVFGLARALWRLRRRLHNHVLVSMMFHPGARIGGPGRSTEDVTYDLREFVRHRLALRLLDDTSGATVILSTSCRSYQRTYQTLWTRAAVEVHPVIGYRQLAAMLPRPPGARRRVLLFLGGAKEEKGVHFCARLGTHCAASMPELEFVFQFNRSFSDAERFEPLVRELRESGELHGNVEIVDGHLDEPAYDALLSGIDIVCMFYDPAVYAFKTSGVFWDALRLSRVQWVVSEGSWMAAELQEIGVACALVPYGDITLGAAALLAAQLPEPPVADEPSLDRSYLELLNRPFGDWVCEQLASVDAADEGEATFVHNSAYRTEGLRILVVRTGYNFGPLSGPGGFVPHLRAAGHAVDEWLMPIGHDGLGTLPQSDRWALLGAAHGWLRSFQGNAVALETRLQHSLAFYDIVHFVDAEHCGLLTCLARLASGQRGGPRLMATFHQPVSVLRDIVPDPSFLRAFDAIQLMSPCQAAFFEPHVGSGVLRVVPHGLAPELMAAELPSAVAGASDPHPLAGFEEKARGRTLLLSVGSWLRDHSTLLAAAQLLATRSDLLFVVVGKGLQLEVPLGAHVVVLADGVSDARLHALYLAATALVLPLVDGAANNAVLEGMAHGLPIVTTDLPSTRYYTGGLATFCAPSAIALAQAIEVTLDCLADAATRRSLGERLRARAAELTWPKVARAMERQLYAVGDV